MTKESTTLPSRKKAAILVGFLVFQLLFFPFNETFGSLNIPLFGTLGFLLTILAGHAVNFTGFVLPQTGRSSYIKAAAIISIAAALGSMFRASMADRFLLSGLASFWWVISFYLFTLPKGNFGSFAEILLIPMRFVTPIFEAISKLMGIATSLSLEGSKTSKAFSKLTIGLVITIPVAGLLLALLSSADPVFGKYIERIFSFDLTIADMLVQVLWRAFFSVAAIIFLAILVLMKIKRSFISPASSLPQKNSHLLSPYLMLATTLCVILFFFLIIQFKYLAIGDLKDLASFGIPTFSDYVRKGFVELVLATGLVYTASGIGLVLYRNFKPGKVHLFVNSLLIFLNLVLATMAYRRVYLYMAEHGLTHMRIYGIMVLLIIVLFLLTLFTRYFINKHKLYQVELLGATLIVFLFGIANTDYLLARVAPPTVNNEVDFNYLSRLSVDAHSWIQVYSNIKENALPLIDKQDLSLDEKILVVRSYWAILNIYNSTGNLVYKYGSTKDKELFSEAHFNYGIKNVFNSNAGEYIGYRTIKYGFNFVELKNTKDKLEVKSMPLLTSGGIPHDVYQFIGN